MKTLTPKQRAFVEHYLACGFNATEAAKRAGYSEKTANEQGSRLLANVSIRAAVDARLEKLGMGSDEVLARLAAQARATMDDFIGSMDRIDLDRARARGVMQLVKKVKQRTTTFSDQKGNDTETHDIELELYDAQAALVHLGRYHKLFTDRVESVPDWRELARQLGKDPDKIVAAILDTDNDPT